MPTGNGQPRTYVTSNPSDWTPGNTLFTPELLTELLADPALSGNQCERVDTEGAVLEVDLDILLWFPSVLSAPEEAAADAVVLAHNGVAPAAAPELESDGTEVDGELLIYDSALTPPGFKNVAMSGDATIDKDGVLTVGAGGGGGSIDYLYWDNTVQKLEVGNSSFPNYIPIHQFVFGGSIMRGTPTELVVYAHANSSSKFFDFRIIDVTNGNAVIAEILNIPSNAGVPLISTDSTLTNISTGQAIWEMQARKSAVNGDRGQLYSTHLNF